MSSYQEGMISDEVWLIEKSLSLLKNDAFAAKSWLLTARTLFPRNFQIQYQAFRLEKMQKNSKKVALLLEEMLMNFPQERLLWEEVHQMIELLQTDTQDDKNNFLKEVFDALPPHLQCHVLLTVADKQTDVLQQCRLVMLVLQRYPMRVAEHGIKLIESLITAEKQHQMPSPVNCYRKYLVYDVLPLVLKAPLPNSTHPMLVRWLQKATEFYITYITQPPSPEMLMSPTSGVPTGGSVGSVISRRVSVQGLAEKDCYISNPWDCLIDILKLTSTHLGWNIHSIFANNNHELVWQQLTSLYEHLNSVSEADLTPVFYGFIVLCFDCLITYTTKVEPDAFTGMTGASSNATPLLLVEGFKAPHNGSPEHKKKTKIDVLPQINACAEVIGSKEVIQSFQVAAKCWQLLHAVEKLNGETQRLLGQWQADNWLWLHSFQVDYAIYQGHFKEAISLINKLSLVRTHSPNNAVSQMRSEMQLASCFYCLKNLSKCCESVLSLVQSIPQTTEPPGIIPPCQAKATGRQLQLMVCNGPQVFSYCIHLLITCLKEKAWKTFQGGDVFLGHMIVLLQYDWPRYEQMFTEVTERIKKRGSFTYNIFFNYVVNIDILEEFAFLKSQEGGKINLDILQISSKNIAQSRTVTRGVNKVVKEDFKSALEKQVSRSNEQAETIIRTFFLEEKEMLQQNLL